MFGHDDDNGDQGGSSGSGGLLGGAGIGGIGLLIALKVGLKLARAASHASGEADVDPEAQAAYLVENDLDLQVTVDGSPVAYKLGLAMLSWHPHQRATITGGRRDDPRVQEFVEACDANGVEVVVRSR